MSRSLVLSATILIMLLFVALGCWQLDRAEQKQALLDARASRSTGAEFDIAALRRLPVAARDFARLTAHGEYLAGKVWLLDNAVRNGRVGFEVLQAFRDQGGALLLVNRGWIEGNRYRSELPVVPRVQGSVRIVGVMRIPASARARSAPPPGAAWPRVLQAIDLEGMGAELDGELLPLVLRLDPASPGALLAEWPATHLVPARHQAYALQWFTFAALLPVLLYFAWRGSADAAQDDGENGCGNA